MRSIRRDAKGSPRANPAGPCSSRFSPTSSASGPSPTKAYGKCAAGVSTSPIPRSWHGSPSIARSRARSSSASKGRSIAGVRSPPQSTPTLPSRLRPRSSSSFVQSYGSKHLDASLLLLPLVGFLPPDDPRVRGTLQAIERRLLVDGFVMRYDTAATRRRLAARGRRLPGVQLLAGRRLHGCRIAGRTRGACSSGCSTCETTSDC